MRFVAPLLVVASATAFAQPASLLIDNTVSRGVTLPPTTAALVDEATAPVVNVAGLSQLQSLQLFYLHDRNIQQNLVSDAIFLGDRFFGLVGVGLGFEWIRTSSWTGIDRNRTTLSLSLGPKAFAVGASLGLYGSDNDFIDDAVSLNLGVMSRPNDWLSLGLGIKNVNQPRERFPPGTVLTTSPLLLLRTYEVAAGFRPFGDRLTLSASYIFTDDIDVGSFQYVAQGEVLRGLVLGAGLAHRINPANDIALQFSATFNLPHFGLTYAGGGSGDGLDHVIQARLSADAYPGIAEGHKVALIDLPGRLNGSSNPGSLVRIGGRDVDAYMRLIQVLAQAERDPDLDGVVFKFETLPDFGMARAEELRQAIQRLRHAGKKVISVIFTAGDAEYFAAAASDKVFVIPQAMLLVNGLSASVTFFGEASDKLGVKWDVARVGRYKNAPDQFTRADMSPEQREVINAYLDVQFKHLVEGIAIMRNLTPDQVRSAIDTGLITPQQAVEQMLVDGIISPKELEEKVRALVPGGRFDGAYHLREVDRVRWGGPPEIALIPVIGTISSGKSRQDPLGLAEIAGAETVVHALESAASDPRVKAIVLRIDSGGGDAMASDLMYRAVLEAKKKKPVFASMGDVAASGGYYAAMGAQTIFAQPTTLTGSIGVFILKPALGPLADKLGIHNELITRGEQAALFSTFHPWTPDEQAAAQRWVDSFYDDFISLVGKSRDLPKERVHEIAQGHVWSGAAAKDLKLVDELGSLLDAIDAARAAAGLSPEEEVRLKVLGEPSGLFGLVGPSLVKESVQELLPAPPLSDSIRRVLQEAGVPSMTLLEPGIKAQLPFQIRIE